MLRTSLKSPRPAAQFRALHFPAAEPPGLSPPRIIGVKTSGARRKRHYSGESKGRATARGAQEGQRRRRASPRTVQTRGWRQGPCGGPGIGTTAGKIGTRSFACWRQPRVRPVEKGRTPPVIQGKRSERKRTAVEPGGERRKGTQKDMANDPKKGGNSRGKRWATDKNAGRAYRCERNGGGKTRSLENAALGLLLDDGRLERGDDRFIKDILELLAELVSHCMQPWQHEERAQTPTPEPERRTYPLLCQC